MPEKPVNQKDRAGVPPKNGAETPRPPTSTDRDAKVPETNRPEDEKRIERFRER